MQPDKGKCRLCSRQAALCNSHVIPEFFYEQNGLYDDKHRFNILSTEPNSHPPYAQKGIRERLLCKRCEGKLSRWEGYARGVFYGGRSIEITLNDPRGFECRVDYATFKLFQLSILWRVGISDDDGFSRVNLGKHEQVLRRMLLDETPGNAETYGCVIVYSSQHEDITSNMIHCMGMANPYGVDCVRLLLGGFFWCFFLSDKAIDPRQKELFLQETGLFRVLKMDNDPNGYIRCLAKDLYNANPRRFEQSNNDG